MGYISSKNKTDPTGQVVTEFQSIQFQMKKIFFQMKMLFKK